MGIAEHRELLVLSTVQSHPTHGYALVGILEGGLGRALDMKRPAVYAILKRLQQRGWIAGEAERQGSYPERFVYTLTAAGEAALPALVEQCAGSGGTVVPVASVIAHLDALSDEMRHKVLQRLLVSRRDDVTALAAFEGHTGAAGVAFELMRRHLDTEIEVLTAQLAPSTEDGPQRER